VRRERLRAESEIRGPQPHQYRLVVDQLAMDRDGGGMLGLVGSRQRVAYAEQNPELLPESPAWFSFRG